MREIDFIKTIKDTLSYNSYIGDDCAFLEEFGLFVTHDTMAEDIHFSLEYATPEQIGYKAVAVNLSDIASALAIPLYITVSLSLPKNINNNFVKELYEGINKACDEYCVKVIGGDLTGADKIIISICAIGKKQCNYLAQRNNAKNGDIIFTTGTHGSSAAGLKCFLNNIDNDFLKNKHLSPIARIKEAKEISQIISSDIACMDSSDGLFDAVYKIALASNVTAKIDLNKIPYDKELDIFKEEKTNLILFGGEDYELIFTCSPKVYTKLNPQKYFKIGKIIEQSELPIYIEGIKKQFTNLDNTFKHF